MNYYLGIDGGGTKTELVLANQVKKVVAKIQTGPTSLVAVGEDQAKKNLIQGISDLFTQAKQEEDVEIKTAVMGLASIDSNEEERQAGLIFQPVFSKFEIDQFTVMSDAVIALVNGTDREDAIVLIAGTGSNCYGENRVGETAKASGLDYLLADQGSAYDVGCKVLRSAAKSFDGRGPKTVLEKKACQYFQVEKVYQIKEKIYRPSLNKTQIAKLAQICLEALEQNDQVAQAIFEWEAKELWTMVETVAAELNFSNIRFDLILEGSMAQSAQMVKFLSQQLHDYNQEAEIILPHQSSVYGALKLAYQH
ncbi:MAG: BadF/BadG/BcrA/BcrD ATPase family protein [Patescibacteria group bacterium]|nr:BadF/BadG/BcrA/BcrD ATPase family protein [Patescibacteria group bacterium]